MSQKASPSVLLHKSEVTYRDTGVSKNVLSLLLLELKKRKIIKCFVKVLHFLHFYNPEYIEHKISWYLSVILTFLPP